MKSKSAILAMMFSSLALAACKEKQDIPAEFERARPVEVIELNQSRPSSSAEQPGVVEPYRQEQVGFEVGGRVDFVIETGMDVEGAILNEKDKVLQQGEIIARLDPERFQLQVQLRKQEISAKRQAIKALKIDLEMVAASQLNQAKADFAAGERQVKAAQEGVKEAYARLKLADSELKRQKQLFEQKSATQASLDQATSNYRASKAAVDRLEANFEAVKQNQNSLDARVKSQKASIELRKARISEAEADLKSAEQRLVIAQQDLEDCVLRAPFTGRITKSLTSKGAYVRPGEPVVELTVFDPIKVSVEVSATADRQLRLGQQALIAARDAKDQIFPGRVFAKGLVANPDTRTFKVDYMVRNRREDLRDVSEELLNAPRVRYVIGIDERYVGRNGPLFIEVSCIFYENGKPYAFIIPETTDDSAPKLIVPRKVVLEFNDDYATIVNWSFRQLKKTVKVKARERAIRYPKPEYAKGVILERRNWMFRPGDIVTVSFNKDPYPSGFYVPVNSIINVNGKKSIVVVDDKSTAQAIEVEVFETVDTMQRIESKELKPGMKLVVRGLHYVEVGQKVNVVSTLQNKKL